jgi:uncharacterized membrane protein YfcA
VALVGFIAELIDGSIGMAYGVSSNSFLLTLGLAPAVASATIHTAEVFTTLASGVSHLKVGNVDRNLFKKMVIPGCLMASIGAYVLVNFPSGLIRPLVNLYLGAIGIVILFRVFNVNLIMRKVNRSVLAGIGGFMDAVGGGGWGPIVTSTLIADGEDPVKTVGTVNLTEFFVTICESAVFIALMGFQNLHLVVALIIGGIVAAPVGAIVCRKAPRRVLMTLVGCTIIVLSIRGLLA